VLLEQNEEECNEGDEKIAVCVNHEYFRMVTEMLSPSTSVSVLGALVDFGREDGEIEVVLRNLMGVSEVLSSRKTKPLEVIKAIEGKIRGFLLKSLEPEFYPELLGKTGIRLGDLSLIVDLVAKDVPGSRTLDSFGSTTSSKGRRTGVRYIRDYSKLDLFVKDIYQNLLTRFNIGPLLCRALTIVTVQQTSSSSTSSSTSRRINMNDILLKIFAAGSLSPDNNNPMDSILNFLTAESVVIYLRKLSSLKQRLMTKTRLVRQPSREFSQETGAATITSDVRIKNNILSFFGGDRTDLDLRLVFGLLDSQYSQRLNLPTSSIVDNLVPPALNLSKELTAWNQLYAMRLESIKVRKNANRNNLAEILLATPGGFLPVEISVSLRRQSFGRSDIIHSGSSHRQFDGDAFPMRLSEQLLQEHGGSLRAVVSQLFTKLLVTVDRAQELGRAQDLSASTAARTPELVRAEQLAIRARQLVTTYLEEEDRNRSQLEELLDSDLRRSRSTRSSSTKTLSQYMNSEAFRFDFLPITEKLSPDFKLGTVRGNSKIEHWHLNAELDSLRIPIESLMSSDIQARRRRPPSGRKDQDRDPLLNLDTTRSTTAGASGSSGLGIQSTVTTATNTAAAGTVEDGVPGNNLVPLSLESVVEESLSEHDAFPLPALASLENAPATILSDDEDEDAAAAAELIFVTGSEGGTINSQASESDYNNFESIITQTDVDGLSLEGHAPEGPLSILPGVVPGASSSEASGLVPNLPAGAPPAAPEPGTLGSFLQNIMLSSDKLNSSDSNFSTNFSIIIVMMMMMMALLSLVVFVIRRRFSKS